MNLSGGVITGNTAAAGYHGGGIHNHGSATLNLSGAPVVTGNTRGGTANNIGLYEDSVITVTGPVSEGAQIGVNRSMAGISSSSSCVIARGLPGDGTTASLVSDMDDLAVGMNRHGEALLVDRFGVPDFMLPDDLTEIEDSAFEHIGARVIVVPDGCEAIGDRAFSGCTSLTQIRLPEHCTFGEQVFDGCGTVCVFGYPGSTAEAWCMAHDSLIFIPESGSPVSRVQE